MSEERITEVEAPDGKTHTHTTVITDKPRSGGSWVVIALALLVVAVIGIWAVSSLGGAEVAKDNAIAEAADEVGNAAGQVGDAAQNAANKLGD
ncbi:hypothetical protein D6851_01635 [Altericroceibacterium spongiae]|uniref:Uncharacterized protein n=1 Tax=Altericroceibacterium spongiae TaxID=2320269 RepID=A0A420ERA3_9SPHN|nr:hypothetical protein [Altericroceibacterium spongiae]RKF23209.1 hypothetical protein D6851_01635 [Altericroceibacterium spongiae]